MFQLPFWFPPGQRLWSASYAFGFNNGVAIVAFGSLLGLATLLYLARRGASVDPVIDFSAETTSFSWRTCRIIFATGALVYIGLTYLMYLYSVNFKPWLMWETRHFLYRTWLMDVYGLRPYTDFQAEYGPLLTYSPSYVYRLLRPLGTSHEQAYFVAHLLLNLAGLWCIYYLLSRARMSTWSRAVAFGVVALAGFAPYMGLNGVLLRYLCPFACLLLGHRFVPHLLSNPVRPTKLLTAGLIVMLLLASNILLSPEAAAAFAFAWMSYGMLAFRRNRHVLVVSMIALIATGLLCWLLLPAAYYGSLVNFSQGANNLPLLPAPHLIFYIGTMFLLVPPLLAFSLRAVISGSEPAASIYGAMGILCLAMAPGALGRCDPPHVLFFGMGASLLLMIRLSNYSRTVFNLYALGYGCVFVIYMQLVNLQVFYGISPKALLSPRGVLRSMRTVRHAVGTDRPDDATLSRLNQYPRLGLPFATFGDPVVETYVVSHRQLIPDYYISIIGVYTSEALRRKLEDVAQMEFLLMPKGFGSYAARNPCGEYLKSMREWFLYPVELPCRYDPLDPIGAVNSFIADHYTPVERIGSWSVWRKRKDVSLARTMDVGPELGVAAEHERLGRRSSAPIESAFRNIAAMRPQVSAQPFN